MSQRLIPRKIDLEKPVLVLVESRRASFSSYVLQRKDIDVILLRFGTETQIESLGDEEAVRPIFTVSLLRPLKEEVARFWSYMWFLGIRPQYFCNPNESWQYVAQAFAREAGFPFLSEEQVALVRDKRAMKRVYGRLGIPYAIFSNVADKKGVVDFGNKYGWPIILKPIDSDSCVNTFKVLSAFEVEALPAIQGEGHWIAEEFIDGDEYQICAIIFEGRVCCAFTSLNPKPIIEIFDGAMNANITLSPSELRPFDVDGLMQKLADGLGYKFGYLHGEVFVRADGSYVMSEIAARMSGCEVPLNHGLAYGFDILGAIVDSYVGIEPQMAFTKSLAAGDLLLPISEGRVEKLTPISVLMEMPGVVAAKYNIKEGEYIKLARSSGVCAGYVQVIGSSSSEVRDRMQGILHRFEMSIDKAGDSPMHFS